MTGSRRQFRKNLRNNIFSIISLSNEEARVLCPGFFVILLEKLIPLCYDGGKKCCGEGNALRFSGINKLYGFYQNELVNNILHFWLPRCVDDVFGGFVNCFDNRG